MQVVFFLTFLCNLYVRTEVICGRKRFPRGLLLLLFVESINLKGLFLCVKQTRLYRQIRFDAPFPFWLHFRNLFVFIGMRERIITDTTLPLNIWNNNHQYYKIHSNVKSSTNLLYTYMQIVLEAFRQQCYHQRTTHTTV